MDKTENTTSDIIVASTLIVVGATIVAACMIKASQIVKRRKAENAPLFLDQTNN